MSLATRCPTCATAFRVVQDQLKVSAGWVRCGRCGEVFNATDALYDLEDGTQAAPTPAAPPGAALVRQVAPDWQVPGRPGPAPAAPAAAAPASTPASTPVLPPGLAPLSSTAPVADEPPAPQPAGFIASDGVPAASSTFDEPAPPVEAPTGPEPQPDDNVIGQNDAEPQPPDIRQGPADAGPAPDDDAAMLPSFVQQADRAARWRRPWVRALLSLVALGLGALLLAQVAYVQRDLLAARLPGLAPTLAALCQQAGCRIEPLRRIERLTVESSGLARVEGSPLYRLSVVLRNRGDTALMLPSLELAITDASGELVARRVLAPADVGATRDTLDAGQELALQSLLSVTDRRLAGYTIELFYP